MGAGLGSTTVPPGPEVILANQCQQSPGSCADVSGKLGDLVFQGVKGRMGDGGVHGQALNDTVCLYSILQEAQQTVTTSVSSLTATREVPQVRHGSAPDAHPRTLKTNHVYAPLQSP
jgi:hypothetical protein